MELHYPPPTSSILPARLLTHSWTPTTRGELNRAKSLPLLRLLRSRQQVGGRPLLRRRVFWQLLRLRLDEEQGKRLLPTTGTLQRFHADKILVAVLLLQRTSPEHTRGRNAARRLPGVLRLVVALTIARLKGPTKAKSPPMIPGTTAVSPPPPMLTPTIAAIQTIPPTIKPKNAYSAPTIFPTDMASIRLIRTNRISTIGLGEGALCCGTSYGLFDCMISYPKFPGGQVP